MVQVGYQRSTSRISKRRGSKPQTKTVQCSKFIAKLPNGVLLLTAGTLLSVYWWTTTSYPNQSNLNIKNIYSVSHHYDRFQKLYKLQNNINITECTAFVTSAKKTYEQAEDNAEWDEMSTEHCSDIDKELCPIYQSIDLFYYFFCFILFPFLGLLLEIFVSRVITQRKMNNQETVMVYGMLVLVLWMICSTKIFIPTKALQGRLKCFEAFKTSLNQSHVGEKFHAWLRNHCKKRCSDARKEFFLKLPNLYDWIMWQKQHSSIFIMISSYIVVPVLKKYVNNILLELGSEKLKNESGEPDETPQTAEVIDQEEDQERGRSKEIAPGGGGNKKKGTKSPSEKKSGGKAGKAKNPKVLVSGKKKKK